MIISHILLVSFRFKSWDCAFMLGLVDMSWTWDPCRLALRLNHPLRLCFVAPTKGDYANIDCDLERGDSYF
jgi:hypothetical protein